MSKEYICKQDAVDLVNKISNLDQKAKGGNCVSLANLQKADVVPVRLGEWLDGYKMQTCSLCKCRGKKSWTFCPHCGARMIYGKREE